MFRLQLILGIQVPGTYPMRMDWTGLDFDCPADEAVQPLSDYVRSYEVLGEQCQLR